METPTTPAHLRHRPVHTPATAEALQCLYAAADRAQRADDATAALAGRTWCFRAISRLTGLPLTHVARVWRQTR